MPAGLLVTLPVPRPVKVTLRNLVVVSKVAVADLDVSIVRLQTPVPEHAPLQPMKVDPASGVAVNVTLALLVKAKEQVPPQLIPAGLLVIVPLPAPSLATVSVFVPDESKVAVTDLAASIVTVQEPVPEQAPLQPAKIELASGAAVSVTLVLLA